VVPVQIASDKLEYAARTFRPKILKKYQSFLSPLEDLKPYPFNQDIHLSFDDQAFKKVYAHYQSIAPYPTQFIPGEKAARETLEAFILDGLNRYHLRNEISAEANSHLSIYLHFGMLSPREMIRRVLESQNSNADAFIEEALVRRELAENYCYYQKNYNTIEGAWNWAKQSLIKHEADPRLHLYTYEEIEASQTHDALWNECQRRVREDGYLHGYLRMYWAKQVLTWTHSAQEAIDILIKLNDTYFLDGRDPNGYTGIMWSIAGVHDRAWFEQNIFGLVRIMGAKGTLAKSKLKL
jgi:deoxyribodipyrimidine photo-lyase